MKKVYLLIFCVFSVSCQKNFLDEFANKETNEAKFYLAKMEINARNYPDAITILESITPIYLSDKDRTLTYASAYSGRCGLEMLSFLDAMQDMGASTIFDFLMGSFPLALASNVQDCIDAEDILSTLGDESERSIEANLFMAMNSLAKIGTILSSLADTDADGTADGTFDQCDAADLSEPMVREFGASIAVTLLSLSSAGGSYADGALSDVSSLCALDPNLNVFCTSADPSSFSPSEVQALRYAIGSVDFGINSCGGLNFSDCAMANPSCP